MMIIYFMAFRLIGHFTPYAEEVGQSNLSQDTSEAYESEIV